MPSNIDSFIKDTNKEIEAMQKKAVSEAKVIILQGYIWVVDGSPVNLSYYKHSHQITVNQQLADVDTSKMSEAEKDKRNETDSKTAKEQSAINSLKFKNNDIIRITNPLDYGKYLESGETVSKQKAPLLYARTERQLARLIAKRIKI